MTSGICLKTIRGLWGWGERAGGQAAWPGTYLLVAGAAALCVLGHQGASVHNQKPEKSVCYFTEIQKLSQVFALGGEKTDV